MSSLRFCKTSFLYFVIYMNLRRSRFLRMILAGLSPKYRYSFFKK